MASLQSFVFWRDYLHSDISEIRILIKIRKDYYYWVVFSSSLFIIEFGDAQLVWNKCLETLKPLTLLMI